MTTSLTVFVYHHSTNHTKTPPNDFVQGKINARKTPLLYNNRNITAERTFSTAAGQRTPSPGKSAACPPICPPVCPAFSARRRHSQALPAAPSRTPPASKKHSFTAPETARFQRPKNAPERRQKQPRKQPEKPAEKRQEKSTRPAAEKSRRPAKKRARSPAAENVKFLTHDKKLTAGRPGRAADRR